MKYILIIQFGIVDVIIISLINLVKVRGVLTYDKTKTTYVFGMKGVCYFA